LSSSGGITKRWLDRGRRTLGVVAVLGAVGLAVAVAAPIVGAWAYQVTTQSFATTGVPNSSSNPGQATPEVTPGQYTYDTAALDGMGSYGVLPGTATFYLYQSSPQFLRDCSSTGGSAAVVGDSSLTPLLNAPVQVSSSGTSTEMVSSLSAGSSGYYQIPAGTPAATTYNWIVAYHYQDSGAWVTAYSPCNSEPVCVQPTISSTPSPATAVEGQPLTDSAVVNNPTDAWPQDQSGSPAIQFWLNGPNDPTCGAGEEVFKSGWIPYSTSTGTVHFAVSSQYPVTEPGASSTKYTAWQSSWDLTPGTYHWVVDYYFWDSTFQTMKTYESPCSAEPVTVTAPSIVTSASPQSGPLTQTFSDSATVSNVPDVSPAPTVTFDLYAGSSCTGKPSYSSPAEAINESGKAFSPAISLGSAGVYQWQATLKWAGQTLSSQCGSEQVTAAGSPSITTIPVPQTSTVGSTLKDSAVITGLTLPSATDTVSFALYSDPSCTLLVDNLGSAGLGSPTLVGGVPTWTVDSPGSGFAPSMAGTYYWGVTFKPVGDPYNLTTQTCGEPTVLKPTTPVVATVPSNGGSVGTLLGDTATITGLYQPATSDVVDFSLYSNNSCSDLVKDLGSSALAGPTSVGGVTTWTAKSPGAGFAPKVAGTYYWGVTFNSVNDPNNPTESLCGEPVTLTAAGGVLGASVTTPGTGANLLGPGRLASLAILLGALVLLVGARLRRRTA
jgi:hypothetical protein